MQGFVRCDACPAERYPNQLKDVFGHMLCADCVSKLLERFACKFFVAGLVRSSMTLGEIERIRTEKARSYARSEVCA